MVIKKKCLTHYMEWCVVANNNNLISYLFTLPTDTLSITYCLVNDYYLLYLPPPTTIVQFLLLRRVNVYLALLFEY